MDTKKLIDWYLENKRDLPWRHNTDPYLVWLSEIILQQTRVAQGLPYYLQFIKKYPSIKDLAQASEQEVLKLWQGLGYYSRARNMHQASRMIVKDFQGNFPGNYKDLLQLKGVGEYTAAAIASFCYNEAVPVIDGNVYRVYARFFGIDTPINSTEGKKIIKELAINYLDNKKPGLYNQAIMEFGALQCKPAAPKCDQCPLANKCVARQTGKVKKLPVKLPKKKVKKRYFNYFLIRYRNHIVLNKRQGKGIWENLYELPLIEMSKKQNKQFDFTQLLTKQIGVSVAKPVLVHQSVHKLTHQHLYINFWQTETHDKPNKIVAVKDLAEYPMPIIIAKFLENKIL